MLKAKNDSHAKRGNSPDRSFMGDNLGSSTGSNQAAPMSVTPLGDT